MKSSRDPSPWARGTAEPSSLLPFPCHKRKKKEERRGESAGGQASPGASLAALGYGELIFRSPSPKQGPRAVMPPSLAQVSRDQN